MPPRIQDADKVCTQRLLDATMSFASCEQGVVVLGLALLCYLLSYADIGVASPVGSPMVTYLILTHPYR